MINDVNRDHKQKLQKDTGIEQKQTMFFLISSWNLSMTRCLVVMGVFLHDWNASLAAETADLNSSFVVKGI